MMPSNLFECHFKLVMGGLTLLGGTAWGTRLTASVQQAFLSGLSDSVPVCLYRARGNFYCVRAESTAASAHSLAQGPIL